MAPGKKDNAKAAEAGKLDLEIMSIPTTFLEQLIQQQQTFLKEFMQTFQQQQQVMFKSLIDEIKESTDTKINAIQAELIDIAKDNIRMKKENDHYKGKIESQNEIINNLTTRIEELESYSRRECLVIHGIKETDDPKADRMEFHKFTDEHLDITVDDSAISRMHRLGPKSSDKTRPIVVKFVGHDSKAELFYAKKKLKGKKTDPNVV